MGKFFGVGAMVVGSLLQGVGIGMCLMLFFGKDVDKLDAILVLLVTHTLLKFSEGYSPGWISNSSSPARSYG